MTKPKFNLRKVIAIAISLTGTTMFSSVMAQTATTDTGVKIGTTTWATRNVDNFGTFAATPTDAGKFYQWNRNTAWATTGTTVTGWNPENPTGTQWASANNPCPTGWRPPTNNEQKELLEETGRGTWTANYKSSGVAGIIFTADANELFFPAVGIRSDEDGTLESVGTEGGYWSGTQFYNSQAWLLLVHEDLTNDYEVGRAFGASVRCVKAEAVDPCPQPCPMGGVRDADCNCVYAPGVKIGNTVWATRNVDDFGTFAATPLDFGKFYQWNRTTAWNTTEVCVSGWDASLPTGIEWEAANDPCPAGWRVPTLEEIEELLDTDKITNAWTIKVDTRGYLFTDKNTGNTLFLPGAGFRYEDDGCIVYYNLVTNSDGYYWGRENYDGNHGTTLYADRHIGAYVAGCTSNAGNSVRCVAVTATGIELNIAVISLEKNKQVTLSATVLPKNTLNKTVAWKSSAENIATVVNGVVTAIAEGEATITATTEDGKFSADCTVTVTAATGIGEISQSRLTVYPTPANTVLFVELEKLANGRLTLFDMNGKLVLSQVINGNSAQINMSALNAGSYILRLVENGTVSAGVQVIKQ